MAQLSLTPNEKKVCSSLGINVTRLNNYEKSLNQHIRKVNQKIKEVQKRDSMILALKQEIKNLKAKLFRKSFAEVRLPASKREDSGVLATTKDLNRILLTLDTPKLKTHIVKGVMGMDSKVADNALSFLVKNGFIVEEIGADKLCYYRRIK